MISFSTASKATECAIAIQRAVLGYNSEKHEVPIHLRIGISAGEPVTDRSDLFGTTIQMSSRICDYAKAEEIMVSSVIKLLCVGKKFDFKDQGGVTLKGFDTKTQIYKVEWENQIL